MPVNKDEALSHDNSKARVNSGFAIILPSFDDYSIEKDVTKPSLALMQSQK